MDLVLRKFLLDVDDMLPARIVSYDRTRNRAQIEILYRVTMTDGSMNPLTAPAEVPALVMGGGGMCLTFPLKPGDLGWIKASDRDMSLFLQSYEAEPGNTARLHCFEDGVFVPDVMKDFVVSDGAAATLQTMDGTTSVAVKPGSIVLTAGSTVVSITDAGVQSNKPIQAPQFTDGTLKLIGHDHSNPEGGNVGPAKNP
ncbi:Gp138 family membrane-puncturing spike protein [Scandinavium sp.]|uniref:Gp138 family membrane-puncturing spike protein n=1 Tax=Scandinavium sp. TaxID=2830653 RepID=UPI0028A17976|nr:Gp138 family membrane-puncturing spike protein [Scandinavium sp.]